MIPLTLRTKFEQQGKRVLAPQISLTVQVTKDDDKFHGGELRDDKLVELQRPKRSQMIGI